MEGEREREGAREKYMLLLGTTGEEPLLTERGHQKPVVPQAACDVFCVGDDVNIEKANNSLISNDRSWKRNKFRLTYVAEAPELTQGTGTALLGRPL
jgi:hypothetical protein